MAQAPKKYRQGKLYDLDIRDLVLDSTQPRKYLDAEALAELKASIEKHGVLQPVLVRTLEEGGFVVVSGERRFQASVAAGLSTIPALLTDGDPMEISIVENLLREDLTAIEEAEAIERLRASHSYQLKDLSGILGKAESTICEILSLNKLPDQIKDDCRKDRKASRALLVKIAKEHTPEKMNRLYQRYKESGGSAPEARLKLPHPQEEAPVDFSFVGRCTRRLAALDPGQLTDLEREDAARELKSLRSAAFRMLKVLRAERGETTGAHDSVQRNGCK